MAGLSSWGGLRSRGGLRSSARLKALALPAVLVAAVAVAAVVVVTLGGERLLTGADPLAGLPPVAAGAVFVLLYAAATVVLVPKPLLNVAAGAWFGLAEGLGLAVAATTLGAAASFALARRVLRGRRPAFRWPTFRRWGFERRRAWAAAAERELREHGFRAVLAMRLLPVLPFAAINYGCALGGTRLRPFAAATVLGVVPGTAALVLAGATASAPSPLGVWASIAALMLLGAVTVLPRLVSGKVSGRGRAATTRSKERAAASL
ncbi:putative membrane protein YdjX (TVP38/TMEM64 family) [Streptacidiphilus sp. MAP12-20]|uniref:TVP38/TMEM64 family protein n=1 Tax=Streptacidiphilus sp. MAP12-20 TaxID=3156299 RepID=UPI003514F391